MPWCRGGGPLCGRSGFWWGSIPGSQGLEAVLAARVLLVLPAPLGLAPPGAEARWVRELTLSAQHGAWGREAGAVYGIINSIPSVIDTW